MPGSGGAKSNNTIDTGISVGSLVKLQTGLRFIGEHTGDHQLSTEQIGIVLEIHAAPAGIGAMAGKSAMIQWADGTVKLYSIKLLERVIP